MLNFRACAASKMFDRDDSSSAARNDEDKTRIMIFL
jgi:hypothetical protein